MDKKILILKNDRVGDFFHSCRNLEILRYLFDDYKIDLCLSSVNIRFSDAIKHLNFNLLQTNLDLNTKDKVSIFLKLINEKYEYVFILTPKNFYFYLPIFFRKTKFLAICIDSESRGRPSKYLRSKLYKKEVNNRKTKSRKLPIYELEKKLILSLSNDNFKDGKKSEKKGNIGNKKFLFHYKNDFFKSSEDYSLENIFKLLNEICYSTGMKANVSSDLENSEKFNGLNKNNLEKFNLINLLGSIDASELTKQIKEADLIITPHGAISCIAAYFNKDIIDIFDSNLTKNAFYEFKPYTLGRYKFMIKPRSRSSLKFKLLMYINSL